MVEETHVAGCNVPDMQTILRSEEGTSDLRREFSEKNKAWGHLLCNRDQGGLRPVVVLPDV